MTIADYRRWAAEPNRCAPDLSVVIPTYNEEWRLLPTIGAIATHVSSMGLTWELIIADDGSTDATVELVRALDLVNLRLLVAERNGGKGSAVRRGVRAARGRLVLFADADQSTPIEQLDRLIDPIASGRADVAVGSRAAGASEVRSKRLLRRVLSRGLQLAVRAAFPLDIEDTQCGFKLFSADAAAELFGRQLIDGFSFDLEVLYLAHRRGFDVAEVAVEWIDAPGSTVDPGRVAIGFLRDLALIRWNDVRGRYGPLDARPVATGRQQADTPVRERGSTWTSSSESSASTAASSSSGADSTQTKSEDLLRPLTG